MLTTTLLFLSVVSMFVVLPINICFWYLMFMLPISNGSRVQKKLIERKLNVVGKKKNAEEYRL